MLKPRGNKTMQVNAKTTKRSFSNKIKNLSQLTVLSAAMLMALPSFAADTHHSVGLFAGILDADENENVVGLEYEYKINSKWGVGATYEKAADAHHGDGITSTIAQAYFHPSGGWRIGAGVGREKVGGHHPHTEDLTRLGVSYDFHVGGMGIAPSINFDRVDGHTAKVYGVAFVWFF